MRFALSPVVVSLNNKFVMKSQFCVPVSCSRYLKFTFSEGKAAGCTFLFCD